MSEPGASVRTTQAATRVQQPPGPPVVLRRACACGGTPGADGECARCRASRLRRQAGRGHADTPGFAPAIVHSVLAQPGRELDDSTRGRMERRLGHRFADVRIHDDASARASARAVDALAYAVGNHVVLGGPSDDRLLAHELAHVVQQRGVKWTGGALPVGSASDPSEREAEAASHGRVSLRPSGAPRLARQRATPDAGTGSTQPAPAPPTVTVGSSGAQGTAGAPAPAQPPPPPRHCIPARPLTWADYPVRARAAWPAQTGFSGAVKGRGRAAYYEVRFDARSSWVLPKYVHPANRRSNGCAPLVQSCRRALASGRTWSFTPDQSCAASIHPTAVPTTVGECETVFGVDCDRAAVDESNRLLAHEQGHFDLACVIAGKATAALAAGATPQAVNDAFGNLTGSDSASLTSQYDDDTGHGCDATEQANWLQSIANGLPNTTVP